MRYTRIGALASADEIGNEFRSELDSHADTCLVSEGTALITHDYERTVRLFGYDDNIGQTSMCKTVTGVVAYDSPETGEAYMLSFNQAILAPRPMGHNLISPPQMRDIDIRVNDEPKHSVPKPTDEHNAIIIPRPGDGGPLVIPLSIHGVFSYFPCRKPTLQKYEETPDE